MTLVIDRPKVSHVENHAEARTVTDPHVAHGFAQANLVVSIVIEDGRFLAATGLLPMYGEGDTMNAAVRDLLVSMGHLRHQLERGRGHLSPELAEQLRRLEALGIASI